MSRLLKLKAQGQSAWLDYIDRSLLAGGLQKMVAEDGVCGVTSNPSIFQKAIAGGSDYAGVLAELAQSTSDAKALYEAVAIRDIQAAADILAPVYASTNAIDGYVSLEVSPQLARDTTATIAEARRLWAAVDRPNLMVKVPGTAQGMPAIETLISEGINVNVTLLFSRAMYQRCADAFINGLNKRDAAGQSVARIASVASFFISRIDASVDAELKQCGAAGDALQGKIAIANAQLAYQHYLTLITDDAWQRLAAAGAQPQRLLWASTSTKSPNYSDVLYIEELIGVDTVNTVPPATLDAFRDHGVARAALPGDMADARSKLEQLAATGVSLDNITAALLEDGIKQFADAFSELLTAVEAAR